VLIAHIAGLIAPGDIVFGMLGALPLFITAIVLTLLNLIRIFVYLHMGQSADNNKEEES